MSKIKCLVFQLIGMLILTEADDISPYSCILPDWHYFTMTNSCVKAYDLVETMFSREDQIEGLCNDSFKAPDDMAVRPFNIKSDAMMDFIVKIVLQGNSTNGSYWTGLHFINDDYLWSDGTNATYFKWAPDLVPPSEPHCVKLFAGHYYNVSCVDFYNPICELYGNSSKQLFTCSQDFRIAGDDCEAKDKCSYKNGGCDHTCVKTENRCACNNGYRLVKDGHTCLDIDECKYDNGGCEHRCKNTDGTYVCECYSGYQLISDGKQCVDIDECLNGDTNGGCDHNCLNGQGGRLCTCREGFLVVNVTKCLQLYNHKRELSEIASIVLACLSPLALIIFACLPRLFEKKRSKKTLDDSPDSESTVSLNPNI